MCQGDQAEEGSDEDHGHVWTVEELEGLLSNAQKAGKFSSNQIRDMAANMEFEATMNKMTSWTPEIVEEELARAHKLGVSTLQILRKNLVALSPSISCLASSLQSLLLGENKLSSLPEELKLLTNLRELELNRNQFKVFPPQIRTLPSSYRARGPNVLHVISSGFEEARDD